MDSSGTGVHDSVVLLRQARHGEGAALGALLEKLRPWLRIVARGRMGSEVSARVDASDVIQQTCLSVYRKIQQFQGDDIAQFMAWVREIHLCNVRDEVRRHTVSLERAVSREVPLEALPLPARTDDAPERRLLLGEDALRLAEATEKLPPAQRDAVTLRYLEGQSVAAIAAHMQVSADAVSSLLRRGLQQLRTRLERGGS